MSLSTGGAGMIGAPGNIAGASLFLSRVVSRRRPHAYHPLNSPPSP
jgi:hypothetical protein